jgi:hypothetical protein
VGGAACTTRLRSEKSGFDSAASWGEERTAHFGANTLVGEM